MKACSSRKLGSQTKKRENFMREALKEASKGFKADEVPVGAVIVSAEGAIVGRGHNRPIVDSDPTAHAEIVALRKAASGIGNYRLNGCSIYVTVEPCAMCAGALVWSRISEIVYGAKDAKAGACGSTVNIASNSKFNHRIKVTGGILERECAAILRGFFKAKRKR